MSSAPPFGSNARTVVINVTPEKLKAYNLSADEVVDALIKNNSISPSGNLRVDSTMFITTINSLESTVEKFEDIPIKSNGSSNVFIRDIGSVSDGADITVDYALVNGKRSVYIPVVKTADASTWDVVQTLRSKLPEMKSLLPDDVNISYEFDQSVFVINSAKSLDDRRNSGCHTHRADGSFISARLEKQPCGDHYYSHCGDGCGVFFKSRGTNHQYHDAERARFGDRYSRGSGHGDN